MRGMEHDGNYTGFTVLGFGIVVTVSARMQLMYVTWITLSVWRTGISFQ